MSWQLHRFFRRPLRFTAALAATLALVGYGSPWERSGLAQSEPVDNRAGVGVQATTGERQSTERRVALVIGNADYTAVGRLRNPVNDARDMGAALQNLGFEVILVTDASLGEMEGAVEQFYAAIRQGGVGLFYYAGHGIQAEGENFLVPVTADLQVYGDLYDETFALNKVLSRMDAAGNDINIIILDACRNNPFEVSGRSFQRGLADVRAAFGLYIAYATAPNSVAADGEGRNGTFTAALLRHIQTPGLSLNQLFDQVRADVSYQTGRRQIPFSTTSLVGPFAFNEGDAPTPRITPTTTQTQGAPSPQPADVICLGSVCTSSP